MGAQLSQAGLRHVDVGSRLEPKKTAVVMTSQNIETNCRHGVPSSVQRAALYHATPGPPRCRFGTSHRLTNLRNQLNKFLLTDFGECLSTGLCYFGRRQYIFTDADKTRPLSKFRPLSSGFDADFPPTAEPRALYASALSSRISGAASALSKAMDIEEPFRTLFTNAGRKHAIHVPALCRTLL